MRFPEEVGAIRPLRYEQGKGVRQDYVLAHLWTNLSTVSGAPAPIVGLLSPNEWLG